MISSLLLMAVTTSSYAQLSGQSDRPISLSLPNANWTLEIPAGGFVIEKDQTSREGTRDFSAINRSAGVVMSVFLEPAPSNGSSNYCREFYWEGLKKNSPLKMDDVKMSDMGEMTVLEYIVREHQGVRVDQKHLNAYLAKGNTCIDIHLSKVQFSPEDERVFTSILASVRLRDRVSDVAAGDGRSSSRRSYDILNGGTLELSVPANWKDSVRQRAGGGPTIAFAPVAGTGFQVFITPLQSADDEPSPLALSAIRATVESSGQRLLSQAVEKKLVIKELRGPEVVGYFYSLTDKTPRANEYKYMIQGVVRLGNLKLTFTILSNVKDGLEQRTALDVLKTARHTKRDNSF
jgi:hypothetical protein